MTDLCANDPWGDALPLETGACRADPLDLGPLAWIAPYPGQAGALEDALGFALPAPGTSWSRDGLRCLWFGREAALLIGQVPGRAAGGQVEDVSDGWAGLRLSGAGALDVLARLVPVDLRALPDGGVVRSLLGHMQVAICAHAGGYEVFVMRSMAGTLAHEVADAMARVAARGGLR